MSHRRIAILLALSLSAAIATATTAAGTAGADTTARSAPAPRASYLQVINDVMCVVCHEPLGVAQSPEAFQEREYIRQLIGQGKTRKQIEDDLVAQYGPAVLARPPAHGVNLLVYIVPPLVLVLGIVVVAVLVPRWRRTRRPGDSPPPATAALDAADAQRLNEDLGRFA